MATLERRVDLLERGLALGEGITVIAIQLVGPGNPRPGNRFCRIDGATYTRDADELPTEFDNRMRAIAEVLNRQRGRPVLILCSPEDLDL